MYISNSKYSLKTIKHTKIDKKFIEVSYSYQKRFPGKWEFFANNIIKKPEICYFRDTTSIINVNLIDFNELTNLFEILKLYLNNRIIKKIIYKKEFIIIHFNNDFHVEFIKNPMYLLAINLFKFLDNNYSGILDVFFGAVLSINNIKETVEIVAFKDSYIYLFMSNYHFNIKLDDKMIKVLIYELMPINILKDEAVLPLKLSFSETEYYHSINNLFINRKTN